MFPEVTNVRWAFPILGVAAAGLALVAIWTGTARWPAWHWRWAILLATLGTLQPITAYGPAALFLVVLPITALGTLALGWRNPVGKNGDLALNIVLARPQFSLRDLAKGFVFIGVGAAMFSVLWKNGGFANRDALLAQAGGMTAVSLSAAAVFLRPVGLVRWLSLVASFAVLCAVHVYWEDALEVGDYFGLQYSETSRGVHWLYANGPFLLFLVLTLATLRLAFGPNAALESRARRRIGIAARGVLCIAAAVALPPFAFLYIRMLIPVPMPVTDYPPGNSLPRVLALAQMAHNLNPQDAAVFEIDEPTDGESSQSLRDIYSELDLLIIANGYHEIAPLEVHVGFWGRQGRSARALARVWSREADTAAARNEFNRSANYSLKSIQLGNLLTRGGTSTESIVGVAVEGMGAPRIARIRDQISLEQLRSIASTMERIDLSREDVELILARDAASQDITYGWHRRLDAALFRLRGEEDLFRSVDYAYRAAFQRRDAQLRLLMTALALRLYRECEGNLPEALTELCPEFLTQVPTDPYSGRPLVYRHSAETYLLYSVGKDGVDNGGNFPSTSLDVERDGFDLDLDAWIRTRAVTTGE